MTHEELLRRAMAAYFRSGGTEQPSSSASGVQEVDGLMYVVLRNVNAVLSVYRVRPNGLLKGLKRWPQELSEY